LELHEWAKALFWDETPGTLWRLASGKEPPVGQRYATLIERQVMLARVRAEMRSEGAPSEADEDVMAATYRRPTS